MDLELMDYTGTGYGPWEADMILKDKDSVSILVL